MNNKIKKDHRDIPSEFDDEENCDRCDKLVSVKECICYNCSTHRVYPTSVWCKDCTPFLYTIQINENEYCPWCATDEDEFMFCNDCSVVIEKYGDEHSDHTTIEIPEQVRQYIMKQV